MRDMVSGCRGPKEKGSSAAMKASRRDPLMGCPVTSEVETGPCMCDKICRIHMSECVTKQGGEVSVVAFHTT